MREKSITVPCAACGTLFTRNPAHLKRVANPTCSRDCRAVMRHRAVFQVSSQICPQCGIVFHRPPSQIKGNQGRHCSLACAGLSRRRSLVERFWSFVDQSQADGCWPRTGSKPGRGYGWLGRGAHGSGSLLAHRVAWEVQVGPIPHGMWVLHGCDNPACVRVHPDHLHLGSPQVNSGEMIARQRQGDGRNFGDRNGSRTKIERRPRGSANSQARLSEVQVREIRQRHAAGESFPALAATFGVSSVNIGLIVRRQAWKHVD